MLSTVHTQPFEGLPHPHLHLHLRLRHEGFRSSVLIHAHAHAPMSNFMPRCTSRPTALSCNHAIAPGQASPLLLTPPLRSAAQRLSTSDQKGASFLSGVTAGTYRYLACCIGAASDPHLQPLSRQH